MTSKQLKEINKIAETIGRDFIVSAEDNASPYAYVTKEKVFIYAGHALEGDEYVQQLYHTVELNQHDKAELIEDAAGWLLAEVFYNMFIAKTV